MLGLRRTPEPLPRSAGWAVLGVLAVFVGVGIGERAGAAPVTAGLAGAATLLLSAATFFGPVRLLPVFAVLAATATAVLAHADPSNISWFTVALLAGWCALSAAPVVMLGYLFGALVLFLVEAVAGRPDPGWAAWVGGTIFSVVGFTFGRRQRDLNAALREAQAGLAQRAQAEERNRIARELHDVIAHSLTVSLMHVTGARLAVRDDPADAERALAEAERLGRASLEEVRQVVGLLRVTDGRDVATPQPAGADLPGLVDRFRGAGADVRASFDGDLAALPGTVGLAAYRIVQESLTNAGKHAPHARATVRVAVGRRGVEVDVDTAGVPGRGAGLGLVGMRERAAALGGRCEAGPGGSGWLVHAELPIAGPGPER